ICLIPRLGLPPYTRRRRAGKRAPSSQPASSIPSPPDLMRFDSGRDGSVRLPVIGVPPVKLRLTGRTAVQDNYASGIKAAEIFKVHGRRANSDLLTSWMKYGSFIIQLVNQRRCSTCLPESWRRP